MDRRVLTNREKEICISPGRQVLNGEEALVYARNRKQLANGDFGRAEHQQEIIKALMNKIKTVKDVSPKYSFKNLTLIFISSLISKTIIQHIFAFVKHLFLSTNLHENVKYEKMFEI